MGSEFNGNNDDGVINIDPKKMGNKAMSWIPPVVILGIIVIALINSWYMLEDRENGVVLRLGRLEKIETQAGLHFKVPFVETVRKVDVKTVRNMEYGFRTEASGTETASAVYSDQDEESLVILDGANNNASIALIELVVRYRISQPFDYLFKVDDPEGTLRLALEDSVRSSVQSISLDAAKQQKELIDEAILPILQKKMNDYSAGIEITLVATQNVQFLDSVEEAYQQYENANQYKNGKREDAEKYNNTIIPQAQAEATKLVEDAYAYKAEAIAEANSGVAEFNALYEEYSNNPDILKERYYIESMTEFLLNNKIVVDGTGDNSIYKFYNFDDNAIRQSVVE